MIFTQLRPVIRRHLNAIQKDFNLKIPEENWDLLTDCIKLPPKYISFGLVVAVWIMEFSPVVTHLQTFSSLPFDEQQKYLSRYRNSKLYGVSQTLKFLQTHMILAAYEGSSKR